MTSGENKKMGKWIDEEFSDKQDKYKVKGSEKEVMYNWIKEHNCDIHRVADVGCGNGFFSYIIAKEFPDIDVVGIDNDDGYIQYAQTNFKSDNLKFIKEEIQHLEQHNLGEFDCIIFSEVVEHLPNVNIILKELVKLIKDDGLVMVSTDNLYSTIANSWINYSIFKRKIKYEQWYKQERELDWAHHLYSFSLTTLATTFNLAGFDVIKYSYSRHCALEYYSSYSRYIFEFLFPIFKPKITMLFKKNQELSVKKRKEKEEDK